MSTVHIVARAVGEHAIAIVDRALREIGLDTAVIRLPNDEEKAVQALMAMIESEDSHSTQVWLMPALAVELMAIDEDRASAARTVTRFPPRERVLSRVIVTTDRRAVETPTDSRIIHIADLTSRRVSGDELRRFLRETDR